MDKERGKGGEGGEGGGGGEAAPTNARQLKRGPPHRFARRVTGRGFFMTGQVCKQTSSKWRIQQQTVYVPCPLLEHCPVPRRQIT